MQSPAVSEVYEPPIGHVIQDDPFVQHYPEQGYSIAYEFSQAGESVPEGGNTAVFRIFPHGVTEPVYVTKPEEEATFTVRVLSGAGVMIRATADGQVEQVPLTKDAEVVVRPGEAYSYQNTGDHDDLVLHDVALPAFQSGDDLALTSSLVPKSAPEPREGYLATVVETAEGERVIETPVEFSELLSAAYSEMRSEKHRQVMSFFTELQSRLGGVPELTAAMELALANPEQTYSLFKQYVGVVQKLSQMTPEEMTHVQASWNKLMSGRSGANSASKHNALDVLQLLDTEQRAEMVNEARESVDHNSPYIEAAMTNFVEMAEGGSKLHAAGVTLKDGDPQSDKVLISHTKITNPEALLQFTMSHYMERYFSQILAGQGVEFAAHQKDYFLNAMTDALMLDHFGDNKYREVFDMWAKPRDQGGLGWIKQDRIDAYDPNR